MLEYFGPNVVTTVDDEWRKHRKVCTAAFTKSNLRLVRSSTMKHAQTMLKLWETTAACTPQSEGKLESQLVLGGEKTKKKKIDTV